MKPPDPNENGGSVSETAARVMEPAKAPDVSGESVKPEQMARWVDEAILTLRRASSDPVEFQRLGLWLQRMRRALQ
jgi:hypothetical protein